MSRQETKPVTTRIVTKWSIFKNDIVLNGACLKIFLFLRSSSFARLFLESVSSPGTKSRRNKPPKNLWQEILVMKQKKVVDLYQKNYTLYTLGTQITPLFSLVFKALFWGGWTSKIGGLIWALGGLLWAHDGFTYPILSWDEPQFCRFCWWSFRSGTHSPWPWCYPIPT